MRQPKGKNMEQNEVTTETKMVLIQQERQLWLNTNDIDTMVMVTIGTNNAGNSAGIATPSDTLILSTSNNGDGGPHGSSGYRDADTPTTTMTATRSNTSVGTAYGWVTFIIGANSTPAIVTNPILMF
jgi:hypothetical protein